MDVRMRLLVLSILGLLLLTVLSGRSWGSHGDQSNRADPQPTSQNLHERSLC